MYQALTQVQAVSSDKVQANGHSALIDAEHTLMTIYTKKVCLLGDFAVGKTSLVRRFVYDLFEDTYISSIGVKVSRKTVTISATSSAPGGADVAMMLWDVSSSEEFSRIWDSYLRGTAGAILVCDLLRRETIQHLRGYASDLRKVSPHAPVMIAANKHDLPHEQCMLDEVAALAREIQAPYLCTSAKTGAQIETIFYQLGQLMVT